jgi:hypothetical protein
MTAYGASRPLRPIPAIVFFLNPQPAFTFIGGHRSSCLETNLGEHAVDRRDRVDFGH